MMQIMLNADGFGASASINTAVIRALLLVLLTGFATIGWLTGLRAWRLGKLLPCTNLSAVIYETHCKSL